MKEFAPNGSKFFSFGVESISKDTGVHEDKQEVTKVASLV